MAMIRCALESPDPRLSSAQPTSTQKHLLADVPDLKVAGISAILATGRHNQPNFSIFAWRLFGTKLTYETLSGVPRSF